MSNNGDLKQEGPPTLFNSESETDEAGHTRILASLEGRVAANGKAPKSRGGATALRRQLSYWPPVSGPGSC